MNRPSEKNLTQEIEHGQTIELSNLSIVDPEHAPAHAPGTETIEEESADLQKE